MDRLLLLGVVVFGAVRGNSEANVLQKDLLVTVDVYPSTQSVALGSTVVFVCRVVGVPENSPTLSYQWSCPNGACDISSKSRVTPRSRIVNSNTLTVNVVSESDAGEYRCTVNEGENTQSGTSSYNITVLDGWVMYSFTRNPPLTFIPLNSFVSDGRLVKNDTIAIDAFCSRGKDEAVLWHWPDGSLVCNDSYINCTMGTRQNRGYFWVKEYTSNGDYSCRYMDKSVSIGLYLEAKSVSKRISTFNHSIASFEATHVTSTSIKLTWSKSTQNFSVGYYLSYFRDDFAVSVPPTYMRLLGRDVTTVDVTDLQPGIKYNFSLWAFTEEYNNSRLRQVMKAPINATATTSESAPSKPRSLTFIDATSTNVTLGWLPPASPNGIVRYTLVSSPLVDVPIEVDTVYTTVSFPEEYAWYEVTVRAVNEVDHATSDPLLVCPGVNHPQVPTAPLHITAGSPSFGKMEMEWGPASPRLCDGSVDNYTVQYYLSDDGAEEYVERVTIHLSMVISNLTVGGTYVVQVWATNRIGSGLPSAQVSVNITDIMTVQPATTIRDRNIIVGSVVGGIILIGLCVMAAIIIGAVVAKCISIRRRREVHYHLTKTDMSLTEVIGPEDIAYHPAGAVITTSQAQNASFHTSFVCSRDIPLQPSATDIPVQPRTGSMAYVNLNRPEAKETASSAIHVDEFTTRMQQMYQQGRTAFKREYEKIPKQFPLPVTVATTIANKKKNRYKNIFPYDNNRVKLMVPSEDGTDYINASYVDGYGQESQYIATQGPVPTSILDFWQMIWDQHVKIVVMLTKIMDSSKVKCEQYFPAESGSSSDLGCFVVRVNSLKHHVDYQVRMMELQQTTTGEVLYLTHYLFTGWPDKGVPTYPTSLVSLLYQVKKERTTHEPVVVHCSAGVGRTGTFIGLDYIMDQINAENTVDIKGVVRKMREKRMYMVQTVDQYMFMYNAVREFILCGNTCVRAVDLRRFVSTVKEEGNVELSRQMSIVKLLTQETAEDKRLTGHKEKIRYVDRALWKGKHLYVSTADTASLNVINAAYVDGYHDPKLFIAAQSPMSTTVDDFWSLIWENQCQVVVLLCQLVESGKETCFPFWPQSDESSFTFGGLNVMLAGKEMKSEFDLFILSVQHPRKSTTLQVTILHYKHWPEWSRPRDDGSLLHVFEKAQKLHQGSSETPVVVACNDGLGRSGAFIAIWSLLEQMKTEGQIDVLSTVKSIRTQRPGAVNHLVYYTYCFEAVVNFIDSFNEYSNFKS